MSFLWGNTANQQPEQKKFANISNDQINSNQQAQPVKYLAGRNYVAGDFISPAYNPRAVPVKSQAGKGQSTTTGYKYFADFALVFCTGGRNPVDAVHTVIVDSDIRWTGNVTRGSSDREVIQVEDLGTLVLYWGSETQAVDNVLLKVRAATASDHQDQTTFNANRDTSNITSGGTDPVDAGDPNPYSGHYDAHPAYRGQCYAVFKDWKLGRDRTSVPNIQLELKRGCPWFAYFIAADDRGVNPIAVLYDWLTDTRFGMGLADSQLNPNSFTNTYNALEAVGARISPMISSQNDFRQSIAELLEYYDGWIRRRGTLIEVGAWTKGTIVSSATLTDDDLLKEPELEPQGWGPTFNEVTVVYKDRDHHYNDYVQTFRDPNNFRITGGPRPETLSRPWITDATLAKNYVRTAGAAMALPFTRGDLTVKREWLTNNGMLPGKVFTYSSGFYGLSFLMRLLEVEHQADKSAEAVMTVEWERSKWPSLYIPPAFQGPGGFQTGPRAIWRSAITEVPYLLADNKFDTQLICHAVRGNVEVQGFRVWLSLDGGTTYTHVPSRSSTSSFSSFGKLDTGINNSQRGIWFHLFGIDLDDVESQTIQELRNDTLLCFIDSEVISIGQINSLGHGSYNATNVLRGRYGTFKASHAADAQMFFHYRHSLRLLDNAGFIPGTVIKVKLQPFTADLDFDITTLTPITYTIQGFADIPPPVFSPAPGPFVPPLYISRSATPSGFTCRYTRDGTPVKWTSPVWPDGQTRLVQTTKTIRARFFNSDTGRLSPGIQGIYTKVSAPPATGNLYQCAPPAWTYSGILKHTNGNVVLTAVTPGSKIVWTKVSLGVPTTGSSTSGTATIAFTVQAAGDTLEFYATKANWDDSPQSNLDNTVEITYGGGGHMPPRDDNTG